MRKKRRRPPIRIRPKRQVSLSTIALWQFISFFVMLLLVWVNEVLDLSSLFFGEITTDFDLFGSCILTSFVIIVAIITVGNTYLQQKRMLHGLITICSHCHRIKVNKHAWDKLEDYLSDRSRAVFSHGLCPDCYKVELARMEEMPVIPLWDDDRKDESDPSEIESPC